MVATVRAAASRDPEILRNVLTGRSREIPLSAALSAVAGKDTGLSATERDDLVAGVLTREKDPAMRSAAAVVLRRLAGEPARERLNEALRNEPEPAVTADIALALGYAGDERDVDLLLERSEQGRNDLVRDRAAFAAALIAHRLGLPQADLRLPDPGERLSLGESRQEIGARKPVEGELVRAAEGLRDEQVGFTSDASLVHALRCGPRDLYVALNPEVAERLSMVAERKTVLGAVELHFEADDVIAPAFLVLTSPVEGGARLAVARLTGEVLYQGEAQVKADRMVAHVWTVDTAGVAAAELEVVTDGRTLTASGASDLRTRTKRTPQRLG